MTFITKNSTVYLMTVLQSFKTKFIGDRDFYKRVLMITIPIMIQSGITNFVNFLDNIMVGRLGTEPMSGVAIVNQLIFVFFLCIFGGMAGAGLFTAQYYGKKDHEGIRYTFRYKLMLGFVLVCTALAVYLIFGDALIGLYLKGSNDGGDIAGTFAYAKDYLLIILTTLPAIALGQIYSNTLRECSQTIVPMKAGLVAILINLTLNYLLIYGKLGFPMMGVKGAALATVISRYAEVLIVVLWAHTKKDRCPYLTGVYKSLYVPFAVVKKIFITGMPLLVNETLWSSGVAILAQCYSMRGLNAVAAYEILGVISNVFNVIFFSMGDAIAIIVGQHLGAGNLKKAREDDNRIIALAIFIAIGVALVIAGASKYFPLLYNTNENARALATQFLLAQAFFTPQIAFLHTTYFTLRSGGRTVITFLFDSFYMWVVCVPLAYCLSRYTNLYVIWIYCLLQMSDWIKCVIGFILVKNGSWMQNIVKNT